MSPPLYNCPVCLAGRVHIIHTTIGELEKVHLFCANPACAYVDQLVCNHTCALVNSRLALQLAAVPAELRHPRRRGRTAALLWSVRHAIRRLAAAVHGHKERGGR